MYIKKFPTISEYLQDEVTKFNLNKIDYKIEDHFKIHFNNLYSIMNDECYSINLILNDIASIAIVVFYNLCKKNLITLEVNYTNDNFSVEGSQNQNPTFTIRNLENFKNFLTSVKSQSITTLKLDPLSIAVFWIILYGNYFINLYEKGIKIFNSTVCYDDIVGSFSGFMGNGVVFPGNFSSKEVTRYICLVLKMGMIPNARLSCSRCKSTPPPSIIVGGTGDIDFIDDCIETSMGTITENPQFKTITGIAKEIENMKKNFNKVPKKCIKIDRLHSCH
jgi:hypothetical protein